MTKEERKIFIFFAGIWSLLEVSLGTVLSLSKVPFRGMLMASFACFILVTFRTLVNKPQSSIYLASIVAVVKLIFSLGAGAINSAIAIFIEGLIAEFVFSIANVNVFSSLIAGALLVVYPFFHSLFAQTVIFGVDIFKIYNKILFEIQQVLGISNNIGITEVILIFSFIYIFIGAAIGSMAYLFSKKINKRIFVNEQ